MDYSENDKQHIVYVKLTSQLYNTKNAIIFLLFMMVEDLKVTKRGQKVLPEL
jgi:hypothetical protein